MQHPYIKNQGIKEFLYEIDYNSFKMTTKEVW